MELFIANNKFTVNKFEDIPFHTNLEFLDIHYIYWY